MPKAGSVGKNLSEDGPNIYVLAIYEKGIAPANVEIGGAALLALSR